MIQNIWHKYNLMTTVLDKKLLYDKKKIMEYMYVSKKIKNNKEK